MREEWLLLGALCSCTRLDPLVITGFDTQLPPEGLWVEETLEWGPDHPQFGEPPEVKHHFVLAAGGIDCGFMQRTWDPNSAQQAYLDAADRGASSLELCELDRAIYEEWAQGPYEQQGLVVALYLQQPSLDEFIRGIAPQSGTFYDEANAESADISYGGNANFNSENWPERVAREMDCAAEDPWGDLPSGPSPIPMSLRGPIRFSRTGRNTRADLDTTLYQGESERGSIRGTARFRRCPVETIIEAPIYEG